MAKKILSPMENAFYSTIDPRRRQEISDARMVQEDHAQVSNLPSRFIHEEFDQDRFKFDQNSAPRPYGNQTDLVEGK